jgi:drug/metabolite transporter (DMT)-like permease
MTAGNHVMALLCVALIAAGQILFKLTANSINVAGTVLDRAVISIASASLIIYGIATLAWVYLLQTAPLSRAYPYMALSFVIVGLVSWLYFQEPMSGFYAAGLTLIVLGIIMIAAA